MQPTPSAKLDEQWEVKGCGRVALEKQKSICEYNEKQVAARQALKDILTPQADVAVALWKFFTSANSFEHSTHAWCQAAQYFYEYMLLSSVQDPAQHQKEIAEEIDLLACAAASIAIDKQEEMSNRPSPEAWVVSLDHKFTAEYFIGVKERINGVLGDKVNMLSPIGWIELLVERMRIALHYMRDERRKMNDRGDRQTEDTGAEDGSDDSPSKRIKIDTTTNDAGQQREESPDRDSGTTKRGLFVGECICAVDEGHEYGSELKSGGNDEKCAKARRQDCPVCGYLPLSQLTRATLLARGICIAGVQCGCPQSSPHTAVASLFLAIHLYNIIKTSIRFEKTLLTVSFEAEAGSPVEGPGSPHTTSTRPSLGTTTSSSPQYETSPRNRGQQSPYSQPQLMAGGSIDEQRADTSFDEHQGNGSMPLNEDLGSTGGMLFSGGRVIYLPNCWSNGEHKRAMLYALMLAADMPCRAILECCKAFEASNCCTDDVRPLASRIVEGTEAFLLELETGLSSKKVPPIPPPASLHNPGMVTIEHPTPVNCDTTITTPIEASIKAVTPTDYGNRHLTFLGGPTPAAPLPARLEEPAFTPFPPHETPIVGNQSRTPTEIPQNPSSPHPHPYDVLQ
eukprot:GHVN01078067.1.p1 GENE.GHVN01078067.1~~GHVN01078067.1.p1  ORF type:complete len:705 (-),score=103.87 GHVN01078067.1:369-2237(-)